MIQAFGTLSRRLSLPLLAGLLLLLGGCGGSGGGGGGGGKTLVTVSLGGAPVAARTAARAAARGVPSSIREVRLRVSGPGMEDETASARVYEGGSVVLSVSVPQGLSRLFEVEALDGSGVVRYRGSATVGVAGDRLDVAVPMEVAPTNPALGRWHWRNPVPTGADLSAVAFGEGTFVAVGSTGTVLTSANRGAAWTSRFPGTDEWLWGVAFGVGRFVTVGDRGGVFVSEDDGETWVQAAEADASLAAVAFGGGRFVAVGSGPTVLVSADGGRTWTQAEHDLPGYGEPTAIVFGDGRFYLLMKGEGSTVYSSPDGSTWAPMDVWASYGATGLAFGDGVLLIVDRYGTVATAVSGGSEPVDTFLTEMGHLLGATFGNEGFFVVGEEGLVFGSDDPLTRVWTERPQETAAPLGACAYGGRTLVAVGGGGAVVTYSDDAGQSRWSTVIPPWFNGEGLPAVSAVGFGEGAFVAAAVGIVRSGDGGATWTPAAIEGEGGGFIQAFAYGDGTFLGVGPYSAYASMDGGATWSDAQGVVGDVNAAGYYQYPPGVAYGAGAFRVVSGSAQVQRAVAPPAPGGDWTWTQEDLPEGTYAYGVAYGNDAWVAVGDLALPGNEVTSGTVATSSDDGQTWKTVAVLETGALRWVAYGDQAFVAVDEGGNTYASADALAWGAGGTIPLYDSYVTGLAYGGGAFVAVDDLGFVYSSVDDGATWVATGFHSPHFLTSVTFGDGTFLAGGDQGSILQSEPL